MGHFSKNGARLRKISFKNWIRQYGRRALARDLGVTSVAVGHWELGHREVRHKYMRKIRKLSEGAVTYEAMIDRGDA